MYYLRSVYAVRSLCAALSDAACLAIAFAVTWFVIDPQFSGVTYAAIGMGSIPLMCATLFFNDASGRRPSGKFAHTRIPPFLLSFDKDRAAVGRQFDNVHMFRAILAFHMFF